MSLYSQILYNKAIIELNSIDSTNNYAMQLIDADKAEHGMTITAQQQTAGKGQRGRSWKTATGESLLMSMIIEPVWSIEQQFLLSASTAVAVCDALSRFIDSFDFLIKWPNDIIINDKKTGGILIENVIRGNKWLYAVIGIGVNVYQEKFPSALPHATSLQIETGKKVPLHLLRDAIRENILSPNKNPADILQHYNDFLYKKNENQLFANDMASWRVNIVAANEKGALEVVDENGLQHQYIHGVYEWIW